MKNKILIYLLVITFILSMLTFVSADSIENCNTDGNSKGVCEVDLNSSLISNNSYLPTIVDNNSNIEDNLICSVYFTGIGCPSCAKADPYIFKDYVRNTDNLVIIEYELYKKSSNANFMFDFDKKYSTGLHIPLLIFNQENFFVGHNPVINKTPKLLDILKTNKCPLPNNVYKDGETSFENINLNELSGKPVIWKGSRALMKLGNSNLDSSFLHELLNNNDLNCLLSDINYNSLENKKIEISGASIKFDNAIEISGWKLYWDGGAILDDCSKNINQSNLDKEPNKINIIKVIMLALADSVNPCALAVLLMMLLAITTYNPKNKKRVLMAGLAFCLSVFVMYFIYGLLLIKIFQFLSSVKVVIHVIVAIFAIVLGVLEIRDFISYKPGTIGTEMPTGLRPKVKRIISKITSPKGAFLVGLFVTLFLLPCTLGPYIILGEMLSFVNVIKVLPLLLFYNLIFILPMILVTIIIYFGVKKIEDISSWKEKNIKILHLIAGLIILFLGLGMLFGWF